MDDSLEPADSRYVSAMETIDPVYELQKKFIVAAISRNKEKFTRCLERGVNPNVFFANSRTTALHCFAERGDISLAIRLLMHKDTQLDIPDEESYTPLHLACKFGKNKVVFLLVKKGADINRPTRNGRTPLMLACRNEHFDVVKILMQFQALVNVTDYFGACALSNAASDTMNATITEYLLQNGADPSIQMKGKLPLFLELVLGCSSIAHLRILKIFLDQREYNITELIDQKTGKNCLHFAVLTGYIPLIELLLERCKHRKIMQEDVAGRTPLDVAQLANNREIFKMLKSVAPITRHRLFSSQFLLFNVPFDSVSQVSSDDDDADDDLKSERTNPTTSNAQT